jgi:hypothetical protein
VPPKFDASDVPEEGPDDPTLADLIRAPEGAAWAEKLIAEMPLVALAQQLGESPIRAYAERYQDLIKGLPVVSLANQIREMSVLTTQANVAMQMKTVFRSLPLIQPTPSVFNVIPPDLYALAVGSMTRVVEAEVDDVVGLTDEAEVTLNGKPIQEAQESNLRVVLGSAFTRRNVTDFFVIALALLAVVHEFDGALSVETQVALSVAVAAFFVAVVSMLPE